MLPRRASALLAHAGHESLQTGVPSFSLLQLAYLIAVTGFGVWIMRRPGAGTSPPPIPTREHVLSSVMGLCVAVTSFLFVLFADDPFGTVGRLVYLTWFVLVIVTLFGVNVWRFFTPATVVRRLVRREMVDIPKLTSITSTVCFAAVSWYLVVFSETTPTSGLAWLFGGYLLVVVAAVVFRLEDPIAVAFDVLARRRADVAVMAVAVGSVWFEVLRDRHTWGVEINISLRFVACTGVAAGVILLTAGAAKWLTDTSIDEFLHSFVPALGPYVASLVLVAELPMLISIIEDQLFVLWDPFGRSWQLFGPLQGVTTQLSGPWINQVRVLAIFIAALAGMWELARRRGEMPRDSIIPGLAVIAVSAYLALASFF